VTQSVRRGGAGKALMQCICDIARKWDIHKVMLTVFKGDNTHIVILDSAQKQSFRREPTSILILRGYGVCTISREYV
jgi:hypothetical protein